MSYYDDFDSYEDYAEARAEFEAEAKAELYGSLSEEEKESFGGCRCSNCDECLGISWRDFV